MEDTLLRAKQLIEYLHDCSSSSYELWNFLVEKEELQNNKFLNSMVTNLWNELRCNKERFKMLLLYINEGE